jgi:predicted dienelactone hydrolase
VRRALPVGLVVLLLALAGGGVLLAVNESPPTPATRAPLPGTVLLRGDTVAVVDHLGPKSFVHPGPFATGETTLHLKSDGAPVELWYPATRASVKGRRYGTYNLANWLPPALINHLPPGESVTFPSGGVRGVAVARGRYPLVVFCHGFAGFRDQSTFLTSRLASWGFVVAAPDLLDYDLTAVLSGKAAPSSPVDIAEVESTISLMSHEDSKGSGTGSGTGRGRFVGRLDMHRIAVIGHSLGGSLAEQVAAVDPQVRTFIGMAGASVGALAPRSTSRSGNVPDKPGLLMVGTADHVVRPQMIVDAFYDMVAPKRLVMLRGAGHLAFSDICELGAGRGGLLGVAASAHITIPAQLAALASDGCQPGDLPIRVGWELIRQVVTAQLRYALGFDHSQAGLTGLSRAFPRVVALNSFVR